VSLFSGIFEGSVLISTGKPIINVMANIELSDTPTETFPKGKIT